VDAHEIVDAATAKLGGEGVWISTFTPAEPHERADEIDPASPLAGVPFAVKDNFDVAGRPTTAACPGFAYRPERHAAVVQRLVDPGAIVVGKTNLDQFATGLTGTRGASIDVELWQLPAGQVGLLTGIRAPLGLGRVALDDGAEVTGFPCEAYAADGAPDITASGGWRTYRRIGATP